MGVSKVQFDDDDNMIVDNDDVPLDDDLDDDTSGKNIPWPLIVASDDGIIDSNNQPLVNTNDTDNVTKNCRNSVQVKLKFIIKNFCLFIYVVCISQFLQIVCVCLCTLLIIFLLMNFAGEKNGENGFLQISFKQLN